MCLLCEAILCDVVMAPPAVNVDTAAGFAAAAAARQIRRRPCCANSKTVRYTDALKAYPSGDKPIHKL